MAEPRILCMSGSLRRDSLNTRLLHESVRLFGPCKASFANLQLPLFNEDLEQEGMPAEVQALHDQMQSADALIIATPEYNGNLPGVLKNALDWASRPKPMPLNGTPVAIVSAAAGRAGGIRAQNSLRLCLTSFRPVIVAGPEIAVAGAADAFSAEGQLGGELYIRQLSELMTGLRNAIDIGRSQP